MGGRGSAKKLMDGLDLQDREPTKSWSGAVYMGEATTKKPPRRNTAGTFLGAVRGAK